MKDWIPEAMSRFRDFAENFVTHLDPVSTTIVEQFGEGAVNEVVAAYSQFDSAYLVTLDPKTCTSEQIRERNEAAAELKAVLRQFVKACIANNPKVTDAQRVALGVPVHTGERHPAPVPVTFPVLTVEMPARGQLNIHYRDSGKTGKGKPEGVHGCEIKWVIADGEPETEEGFIHSAFDTHTPIELHFDFDRKGAHVFIIARWENTRGEKGPWSETVSAVIP